MTDLGVVVGRFQIDQLHPGHRFLLDTVNQESKKMLVVLGVGPLPTTARKPLPFETRRAMILSIYPDAIVESLEDHPDDEVWSKNLDKIISRYNFIFAEDMTDGFRTSQARLFHGRDSFKEVYSGKYDVVEIDQADIGMSATLHRQQIASTPELSPEFARGVIWANENKFPTVYSCVDAWIWKEWDGSQRPQVLLITKKGRAGYMLPGGFADTKNGSDEEDAEREVHEETGVKTTCDLIYIGSKNVDDWRYQGEADLIRTRIFIGFGIGDPVGRDDAETAQWVDYSTLTEEDFNPCHRPLFKMIKEYLNDND